MHKNIFRIEVYNNNKKITFSRIIFKWMNEWINGMASINEKKLKLKKSSSLSSSDINNNNKQVLSDSNRKKMLM